MPERHPFTVSNSCPHDRPSSTLLAVHQWSGWFGFLFGVVHGLVLLFDTYVGYSPRELMIPFAAHDHPFLTGFGTLSFYIAVLLLLSSDLIRKLGNNIWRAIHFLAFPGFFLSLIHGFALGTDAKVGWVQAIYTGTAGIIVVLLLLLLRIGIGKFTQKKPALRL
jgi:sulfoxide reductase heme-binding subunit YedZ